MTDGNELRRQLLSGRAGDERAYHAFLTNVAQLLRRYFRKRLSSCADAEDLVQDVLLALHKHRDRYDERYPLTAWVHAIAKHRMCDDLRRRARRRETALEGLQLAANDPAFAAADAKRDLATLMSRLPAKQQTVVRLVKLEQWTVKEASCAARMSLSDVKVSTHRAVRAMQKFALQQDAAEHIPA